MVCISWLSVKIEKFLSCLVGAKCYLLVGLICISFIANEVESLCFMYLLIISTFFLNIFWVICIFLINLRFFGCTLDPIFYELHVLAGIFLLLWDLLITEVCNFNCIQFCLSFLLFSCTSYTLNLCLCYLFFSLSGMDFCV